MRPVVNLVGAYEQLCRFSGSFLNVGDFGGKLLFDPLNLTELKKGNLH